MLRSEFEGQRGLHETFISKIKKKQKTKTGASMVVHTLASVFRRQKQADFCEVKTSLIYMLRFMTTRAIYKKTNKQKNTLS